MQNDPSKSLYLEASTKNKNLYIAYKKLTKRKGFTLCLPVAEILINSGSELLIRFYEVPMLSDEEKNFITDESKKLTPEKLLLD